MSITLFFNGGLFSAQPGVGRMERVDVLSTGYALDIEGDDALTTELEGATRIDFETVAPLSTSRMLLREIAHIIPIDYRRFERFISFNGGVVTPIPAPTDIQMTDPNLFTVTTGVELGEGHYDRMLLAEFRAQVAAGMHERWVRGYRIKVELPTQGTQIIVDGYQDRPLRSSKEDVRVFFNVPEANVIPHFPHSNPHVLEQPPTI